MVHLQMPKFLQFQIIMESEERIEDQLCVVLQSAIKWANSQKQQIETKVLAIEKVLNQTQDTKPITRIKHAEISNKYSQEKSQEIDVQKIHKKYEQILQNAEQSLKNIYTDKKKTIQKQKQVQPLPIIDKKPPIPTANRGKETVNFHKPNPYLKNKNQVTPKITQTPYSSHKKPPQNSKAAITSLSVSKGSIKTSSKKILPQKRQSNSTGKKIEQNVNNKKIQFNSFSLSIEQLLEQQQAQTDNIKNKKPEIDRLIGECEKQELGYKQNLRKYQEKYLNQFSKISAIRQSLPLQLISFSQVTDRNWDGHPLTFAFSLMIQKLGVLISENPISEQYRLDPIIALKIMTWHKFLNQIFQTQISETKTHLRLPPKIGIQFQVRHNSNSQQQQTEVIQNQNKHESEFYRLIACLLASLKELQSLDKPALSKLRTIVSIVLHEGRRSLTLVQRQKYEQWKQYYIDPKS